MTDCVEVTYLSTRRCSKFSIKWKDYELRKHSTEMCGQRAGPVSVPSRLRSNRRRRRKFVRSSATQRGAELLLTADGRGAHARVSARKSSATPSPGRCAWLWLGVAGGGGDAWMDRRLHVVVTQLVGDAYTLLNSSKLGEAVRSVSSESARLYGVRG